jgi:broad specificity phosphatase PhoE
MTRILLVRHGQTNWNREERFRGLADVPLNEAGLRQAEAAARRIASEWRPAAVYSSPLSRAVKTAEAVAGLCGLPVDVCRGLTDIDYGEWKGLTVEEARWRWPEAVGDWSCAPERARIPGGESVADVRTRAMKAVRESAAAHPEETIVLVSHTVVIRAVLLEVLGAGWDRFNRLRQDNCAINAFDFDGADFTVVSLNDTCHLRGLE